MASEELRRGDVVEVRSPGAILATLDASGALEGLPFMPEMARLCGRRFVVEQRAERVCDTVDYSGSRRPPRTVLLKELRCDGSSHGGCEAECRLFWKEAWLRRIAPGEAEAPPPDARELTELLERTARHVRKDETCWSCQNTELPRASEHVELWDPRAYLREYTTGNVGLARFLRVTARATLREPMRKLGLIPEVHLPGTGDGKSDAAPLDLQPGELVQIKTREEIAATLSPGGRHRGMWFDREMLPFCGRTARVRRRVRRFIDERSGGRMVELRKSACVTLEGVVCSGELSLRRWFCPRAIFPYWQECWLRRVPAQDHAPLGPAPQGAQQACQVARPHQAEAERRCAE